ncbi:MAG: hypothetical protein AAGF83_02225 [Cyanobacteria bacterium P01_G01_bin.67]
MKAIVANVLFGGIFGCLGWTNPAQANPQSVNQAALDLSQTSTISAKLLAQEILLDIPPIFGVVDRIFTINPIDSFQEPLSSASKYYLSWSQQPYVHDSEQIDLVLGFQKTFWSSTNQGKYWGVTTVEQWGNSSYKKFSLPQLNYIDSAPVLAVGSSALTFSGGGNNNLAQPVTLDQDRESSPDFENFRGGVAYHHGIASQLTMGVGFIYEDYLGSFTQVTYDSDLLPIKTTFSLIAQEAAINLHSHVLFQPASNFAVNYYHGSESQQKFDLNWNVASNLTLVANGNIKTDSYSTGIKIAVQSDFLSLSATAALDNQNNLQWQLNSQIGRFKFTYNSNQQKSSSELKANLFEAENLGFKCSAVVRYQTRLVKEEQNEYITWGAELNSATKIRPNNNLWSLQLSYGSGFHGQGWNVSGSIALQPNLTLKLDYQEISATSDETKIKLQLSSQ